MQSLYKGFVVAVAVLGLNSAFAGETQKQFDEKYLTIGNVVVEETPQAEIQGPIIIVMPDTPTKPEKPHGNDNNSPTGDVEIDKIINLGKVLWAVVEKNRPVVNIKTDVANALPAGISGWEALGTWQMPQVREYRVRFQNLYGSDVIDFKFRVLYTHGGSFNGKGAYLTNATVLPAHLTVAWGYTFNANTTVGAVMNAGTSADPVAAMQLQLTWSIDTVLKHEQSTENFYIKGDGTFKALGSSGQ